MRQHHRSASPYEASIGFSRALRVGERVLVSGTAPIAPDGSCFEGDAYSQARRCFEIAREALEALGSSLDDVVRTRMYLVDAADWEAVGRAHGEVFRGIDPAATMVVVAGLLDPRWRIEIEVEAQGEPRL
jgi:enamine deaminase RidA (YjgF/YER057c/UK114 family)